MPQLVFFREGREVLRFPLNVDEVHLGRHPDNDISLPDPDVSRYHAVLKLKDEGYQLQNMSRVGTRLKGVEIDNVTLSEQDVFEVGPWRILYEQNVTSEDVETAVHAGDETPDETPMFCGMVGQSAEMKSVFELIKIGAGSLLPVMIQGETGSGKELVAHALHRLSGRRGPFVALNCGAISPGLIESELFGHERGAFTGAIAQHKGAFEQASKGTLFLDEVGELSLELQPKLLRVLEMESFRRIGGTSDIQTDVRVVAATHRELQEEIRENRFREDLFYRLMGLPLCIPPLRERAEDIPLLAHYFLKTASPTKVKKELSAVAIKRLCSYSWPGNVRELKNVLARSLLLSSGPVLEESDLQFLEARIGRPKVSLDNIAKEAIQSALRATGGNKKKAAERLGIAKSTLFRKLRELNFE